jgi:sacsin
LKWISDKNTLQKISFIPVSNGTRLCSAKRIFVRLEMNLAPFAFQLPSSYLPCVQLLTDLGMQESPTPLRMQSLLSEMQNACGFQRLNPNELRAVLKILDFLCESSISKQPNKLAETAIVPDDMGRLVHAQVCVYVDGAGSHMVEKINTSRLRFVHPLLKEEN